MSNSNLAKHIIVEGPIGVGKSSLSGKLAASYGVPLLLEQAAENPFLERFYNKPADYALQTQLFFLFQRIRQLNEFGDKASQARGSVADFMIEKDPLFAKVTLQSDELNLYQQVYSNLRFEAPRVDLLIYLQAPVEILLERVNKRRVKYEMSMDLSYLQRLSAAYTEYFHYYHKSALLIVNAAEINPVDNEAHYNALLRHISQIKAGRHYFNPLVEAL